MTEYSQKWGVEYGNFINRNIGLITEDQQERLRTSKVSVFGLGGVGGVIFEILVRCGIAKFSIIDNDVYEDTNMNRQIFAFQDTIGKRKIDVAEEWAKKINPEIMIEKHYRVDEDNISEILKDTDIAVLAIDTLKTCLIISRKAREMNIPFVQGFALPFGNVCTYTSQTPSMEEVYDLPTQSRPISSITDEEFSKMRVEFFLSFGKIEGILDVADHQVVKKLIEGPIPSFAPIVWFTSVMLALETVKVILNWGKIAISPNRTLYDPFNHRIPKVLNEIPRDKMASLSKVLDRVPDSREIE